MTEYEGCYIFAPEKTETDVGQRASKRRKTSKAASQPNSQTILTCLPFVPLLSGTENPKSVQARLHLFENAWRAQEILLHNLLEISNVDAVANVASFIEAVDFPKTDGQISAGLVVAGPSIATDAGLFGSIISKVNLQERVAAVNMGFTQMTNVKYAVKHITKYTTEVDPGSNDENSGDEEANDHQQGKGLQRLQNYVQMHSIKKVIVSFHDSEAFEGRFLCDLINILKSWIERIPFVLLFGISTSIDIFKDKISIDTASHLQSVEFNTAQVDTEALFQTATSPERRLGPWLGPGLSRAIINRRNDQVKSISSFSRALKYVHMTHYFANPLSIFLNPDVEDDVLQTEHYEAVRNLSSFQKFVQRLIEDDRNPKAARELLTDNISLNKTIRLKIEEGHKSLQGIMQGLKVVSVMQSTLSSNKKPTSWSDLYISGMSGKLLSSPILRETLLSIKKLRSNSMKDLLTDLSPLIPTSLPPFLSELETLTSPLPHPLRSSHEIHNKTLRTTIVASKVELSAYNPALSREDASYSSLVERTSTALRAFFEKTLINPSNLFMHEVLIHDLKSPHRDAFAPKPRLAIERALGSPHDYLGCECCEDSQLMASQPATAVLYQLYLESGTVINVADLWTAFFAIVGNETEGEHDDDEQQQQQQEEEEEEERRVLALFERALAELKYLGMIKNSRKKVDHVAKLLWKGL